MTKCFNFDKSFHPNGCQISSIFPSGICEGDVVEENSRYVCNICGHDYTEMFEDHIRQNCLEKKFATM